MTHEPIYARWRWALEDRPDRTALDEAVAMWGKINDRRATEIRRVGPFEASSFEWLALTRGVALKQLRRFVEARKLDRLHEYRMGMVWIPYREPQDEFPGYWVPIYKIWETDPIIFTDIYRVDPGEQWDAMVAFAQDIERAYMARGKLIGNLPLVAS